MNNKALFECVKVCCPDCLHITKPLDYEEAKCNYCGLIWTWQDCDMEQYLECEDL